MREAHLEYLACPRCHGVLSLRAVAVREREQIMDGEIACGACAASFPVVSGIPRFVPAGNYARSFGHEWTIHARTQYDSHTGMPLSERRFFEETGWPRRMEGERILEVGSGSGRFTEQAASTGAMVVSLDYSAAVDVNYRQNGGKPNVLVVQGDVYSLPIRPGSFDRLFCFGMLQHTPDPGRAFLSLPLFLKPGGALVFDVYKRTFVSTVLQTKYWVRPLIRSIAPERLYPWTRSWVDLLWPLTRLIARIPRIGPALNWRLLVADYSMAGLTGDRLKEWAYLDTFDMLSPQYDAPQSLKTVRRWCNEAGLEQIELAYGHTGIYGRAIRTPQSADRASPG